MIVTTISTTVRMMTAVLLLAILTNTLPNTHLTPILIGFLVGQLAAIFVDAGVNNELLRFAGTDEVAVFEERLVKSVAVRLVGAMSVAGITFIAGILVYGAEHGQLLALAALSAMLATIADSYFMSLRALRKFYSEFVQSVLQLLLLSFIAIATIKAPLTAAAALVLFRIANLLLLSYTLTTMGFSTAVQIALRPQSISMHYSRLRHYFLDSLFANLNVRLDSVIALALIGAISFALYQPSARLYYSTLSLASIVGGLSIPAAAVEPPNLAFRRLMLSFSGGGAILAILLFLVLVFAVGPVFGEEFAPSYEISVILALTLFLRFSSAGVGAFLTIGGWQRERALVSAAVFIFSCIAMLLLYLYFPPSLYSILVVLLAAQIVNLFSFLSILRLKDVFGHWKTKTRNNRRGKSC